MIEGFSAGVQILLMIISSTLSIFVAFLCKKISKEQERVDATEKQMQREEAALKNGIRAILRDRILIICMQCENKGIISVEQLENIDELFNSYVALGGNGATKKIFEDTLKLPVEKKATSN